MAYKDHHDSTHGAGRKTRKCLDCPATISTFGNKVRCSPCGETHRVKMMRERYKERRKKQKPE